MRRPLFLLVPMMLAAACGSSGTVNPGGSDPGTSTDVIATENLPADTEEVAPDTSPVDTTVAPDLAAPDLGPMPVVTIESPARGTFATGCGEPLKVRFDVESERLVTSIQVQGLEQPPEQGVQETAFTPAFGLNVLTVDATDDTGRTSRENRSLLCGTYVPTSEAVVHAADLYLGWRALKAVGEGAARLFDTMDLNALFGGGAPLFDSTYVRVLPGEVSHTPPSKIRLVPEAGAIAAYIDVSNFRGRVVVELVGSPSKFYDVLIYSPLVSIEGAVTLGLGSEGNLEAAIGSLKIDLGSLEVDIPGVAEDVLDLLPAGRDTIAQIISKALSEAIQSFVPQAIDGALAKLTEPIPFDVLDREFSLRFKPSVVDLAPAGVHIALDIAFEGLTPDPSIVSPGVLHTPGDETWPQVEGLRLSIKDDLLNAIFHEVWRSGLLAFHVDQAFLDAKKAEITLVAGFLGGVLDRLPQKVGPEDALVVDIGTTFPPVATVDLPLAGGLRVGIGDLRLDLSAPYAAPSGPILSLLATVRFEGQVRSLPDSKVRVEFQTLSVALDVNDDTGRYADAESYIESTTKGLFETLGPTLNNLLGAIPIPSIGGFTLANVSVGSSTEDGGTVVVSADLVTAAQ